MIDLDPYRMEARNMRRIMGSPGDKPAAGALPLQLENENNCFHFRRKLVCAA